MPTLDCPRALVDPPTCTHPLHLGALAFHVRSPGLSLSVEAGGETDIECIARTCTCELSQAEWRNLERRAVKLVFDAAVEDDGGSR